MNEGFAESSNGTSLDDIKARGTYSPMQFAVRLRKDVSDLVNAQDATITFDRVQAFSTYMHENIHWWQHVGSHFGFLTSLSYPALAHQVQGYLNTMLANGENYKSIKKYDRQYYARHGKPSNKQINLILNNWYDIFYAKAFALDHNNIYKIAKDRRFFLSIGHCYFILWSTSLALLTANFDQEFEFLPDIRKWPEQFGRLDQEKKRGFYIDTPMDIAPVGVKAIYEGQARFNQLQYLSIGLQDQVIYQDFEEMGMLRGIYVEAFDWFIQLTRLKKPDNLNNPIVGLFLLVCDIAINPSDGFPLEVQHFETFIISNDPGIRFFTLCQIINREPEKWESAVKEYSKEEYINLSEELSEAIACISPFLSAAYVSEWANESEAIQRLLEEEQKMTFSPENLSVRLFFSKYLRFQQDKVKYPNIFCWIGRHMTVQHSAETNLDLVGELFEKHKALFIDDAVGEIRPMLFKGHDERVLHQTFESFYDYNVTYDMIMKWISEEGPFTYDYSWLTTRQSPERVKEYVQNRFKELFNIYPEELQII